MKTLTKAWMLFMVVHAFAVSPGLAQPAKTSSFYDDRCSAANDEIVVTVFDTGEPLATVTIKITNLVTDADSSYSAKADDDLRTNCDWFASSEGATSEETNVTLHKNTPYKIEFIKSGNTTKKLFYLQCTTSVNRSLYGFHCPTTAKFGGASDNNDVFIDYYVQTGIIDVFPDGPKTTPETSYDDAVGSNWMIPHHVDAYCGACTTSRIMDYFLTAQIPSDPETGPFESNDDITVPTGYTWDFRNVELQSASGKQLKVDGTLEAHGVTFTASGSSWSGLYFPSGSSGLLDDVTVDKVQSYGGGAIDINNASPTISYSTIKNCSGACSGIYVSNGLPFLYRNTIQGNTTHGISLYNSSASIVQNNITANTSTGNAAVRCDYYATPLFGYASSPYFEGRNTMTGAYYGVYAEDNASCTVGVSSSLAYNNRLINNTYDAYATGGGDIVAKYAWWGENPPTASQIVGDVTYDSYLTSDPGAAFKTGGDESVVIAAPEDLSDLLGEAIELRYQGDYAGALTLLQQILLQAPGSREAQRALIELGHIERARRDGALLALIASHAQQDSPLRVVALEVLLGVYADAGELAAAEGIIETLLRNYARTSHALNARLMRFYLRLEQGDLKSAQEILAELEAEDPADEAVQAARWLLYLEGMELEPQGLHVKPIMAEGSNGEETNDEEMTLSVVSYPNPFNPSTTLRYELPADAHVLLMIYDMLGREVATLVDRQQPAGVYHVSFDGASLSSGTYVYRFDAAGQVKTGRLLLLK